MIVWYRLCVCVCVCVCVRARVHALGHYEGPCFSHVLVIGELHRYSSCELNL